MSKFVLTAQLKLQAPTNTAQVVNQIRSQLSGVSVPVTVKGAAAAQKQIKGVTAATKQATSAAHNMGKAFAVSLKRFAAFAIASRAVTLFTSSLADAFKEAIDFQRQLIKISQVTGKTVKQLGGLSKEVTNLSTKWGVASKDLIGVARILAQTGLEADKLKIALEALAKTTLAPTFENIEKTAEGAVAILAQFGKGVGALEGQLGAVNAIAGQFAVEAGDLIAVVRRTGGVFKAAGGNLNELLALFTSVRATTRESAESISTGLRTIFTRIQRPKTIEFLKAYGVNLLDLEGKFVGPFEAVKRLNAALAGLEQGDIRFVKIAEQLGGFRQIGKVIRLLQQFQLAEEARQAAIEGGNSITSDAAKAQQALAVQFIKVREEFFALIRGIAETSTFQAMVKMSLQLASALIKIGEAIKPLIPLIAALAAFKFAGMMGGFAKGMGAAFRPKHSGGKISAFARGGEVPGVGNGDTVPAMLQPGEFVIRKSSVNKIGVGQLHAMNENRRSTGTIGARGELKQKKKKITDLTKPEIEDLIDKGFLSREEFTSLANKEAPRSTSQASMFDDILKKKFAAGGLVGVQRFQVGGAALQAASTAARGTSLPVVGKKYKAGTGSIKLLGHVDTLSNKVKKDLAKQKTWYGAAFLRPEGQGQITQGKLGRSAITTGVMNDPSVKNFRAAAKANADSVLINGIEKEIQEVIAASQGVESGFVIEGGSLEPNIASSMEQGLLAGVRDTVHKGAQKISGDLANRSAVDQVSILRTANLDQTVGNLFEAILLSFGKQEPYSDRDSSADFDFARGLGPLAGKFGITKANAPSDAKATFGTASLKTFTKKAENFETKEGLAIIHNKMAQTLGPLLAQVQGAANSAQAMGLKGKAGQRLAGNIRSRMASGGEIDGSDTVPALLTPGEFVVNKDSAQKIGYGRLNHMNKKGITGFAKGGPVGVKKMFAGGTLPWQQNVPGGGAPAAAPKINTEVIQTALNNLGKIITDTQIKFQPLPNNLSAVSETFRILMGVMDTTAAAFTEMTTGGLGKFTAALGKMGTMAVESITPIAGAMQKAGTIVTGGATKIATTIGEVATLLGTLATNVGNTSTQIKTAGTQAKGSDAATVQIKNLGGSATMASEQLAFLTTAGRSAATAAQTLSSNMSAVLRALDAFKNAVLNAKPTSSKGSDVAGLKGVKALGTASIVASEQMSLLSKTIATVIQALTVEKGASLEAATADQIEAKDSLTAAAADKKEAAASAGMGLGMKMMAVSMITSFIPAADESSSVMMKVASQGGQMVMTLAMVMMALEQFGVKLSMQSLMGGCGAGVGKSVKRGLTRTGGRIQTAGRSMSSGISSRLGGGRVGRMAGGAVGGTVGGAGKLVQGAAGPLAKLSAGFTSLIGPVAIAAGLFFGITKVMDMYSGVHEKATKAIKEGNTAEAGRLSVSSRLQKDANNTAMAMAGAGAAIGQLLIPIPGLGAAIGGLVGGLGGLLLKTEMGQQVMAGFRDNVLTAFGGLSTTAIASKAKADAAAAKYTNELAENSEKATEALAKVEAGSMTMAEAFASGELTGNFKNAASQASEAATALADVESNRKNVLGAGGGALAGAGIGAAAGSFVGPGGTAIGAGIGAGVGALVGMHSSSKQKKAEEAASKKSEEATKAMKEEMKKLTPHYRSLTKELVISQGASATFGDFLSKLPPELQEAIQAGGADSKEFKQAQEAFNNQKKATLENIAFLKAMNFGMRDVIGSGKALSNSLDSIASSQEAGFNHFQKSADILALSMTEAGKHISGKELEASLATMGEGLADLGADPAQIKSAQDSIRQMNTAQKGAGAALNVIKNDFKNMDLKPEALKDRLGEEILKSVPAGETRDRLQASLDKLDLTGEAGEALMQQLQSGDVSGVMEAVFGPAAEAMNKELIEPLKLRAEAENKLISAIQKRQEAELQYIAVQTKAIDLQLEAASVFEAFGGAKLSSEQKTDARMAQFNLSAANAGVGGLGTGSAADIQRVSEQIANKFEFQQNQAMAGTFTDDPAFKGAKGQEEDRRSSLKAANEKLIQFTKQRIGLLKEELAIVKQKNAAEKSALEKLISGDITGFIEGQAAAGAGAALRTGDAGLASLFGAGALGAGFKTLEGQGLSGGQMERAAGMTLGAVGLTDQRSAQVLAGTTNEAEAINREGRALAESLGGQAQQMADMEKMNVTANEVIVNAQNARFAEASQAQGRARGGLIYASRGIFVPRGTDTVPAMLTPGEFVVNRAAVNRGNNLQILRAMNGSGAGTENASAGMANGGQVGYYSLGDLVGQMGSMFDSAIPGLTNVFSGFQNAVDSLQGMTFGHTIAPVSVSIDFLNLPQLKSEIKDELFAAVEKKMSSLKVGSGGGVTDDQSLIPKAP